jgi:hypothetical protein
VNLFWIYDIPNWASFLVIVGATLAVGLIGLFGLSPWVSHLHVERNHNEAVSYFWSAVVLFYGVMVGLIAVGVWQQFSNTDEKVALEASALAALYRDVSAYPEPFRARLQADLRKHTQDVIQKSWPLQRKGLVPSETNQTLWRFQADMESFQPSNSSQSILHAEAFRTYNNLVELRRMRLHNVESGLPAVVWVVVALGALITLSVGWFFKTTTFAVHFWMEALTALLLGLIIWLLVMMDHPFLGQVSIGPEAFERVYTSLMKTDH